MRGLSIPIKKYLSHPLAWLAFLILGLVPFFCLILFFYMRLEELNTFEGRMEQAHKKAIIQKIHKEKENVFLTKIKNVDHFYIDKHLETLAFLEHEVKRLQASAYDSDDMSKKRLAFLKEGSNRLLFSEEKIRHNETVQETEEKQQHPVEMNEEDLKKLLSLIEGTAIGPYLPKSNRPQLIIKNFELSKKPVSSEEDVFVVNMQLIKRESSLQPNQE
jgi:hypothetical protein